MTTKESLKQEIDKLSEEQFQLVADFIEFIKFRTQKVDTNPKKRLSEFYGALKTTQPWQTLFDVTELFSEDFMETREQPNLEIREGFE
jgi:hypothetical protein